jgi:NHL repeat
MLSPCRPQDLAASPAACPLLVGGGHLTDLQRRGDAPLAQGRPDGGAQRPDESQVPLAAGGGKGRVEDGGPATGARLLRPEGVAAGPAGSILIADTDNGLIRAVTG